MSRRRVDRTAVVPACRRLRSWDAITEDVKDGIRALRGAHRELVVAGAQYRCSIDLDEARREAEPNAARWDYVLAGIRSVGMEVHPAKASEVDTVIRKKQWAHALLVSRCGLEISEWRWVRPPRSSLQFTATSPEARRLAKNGVHFPSARLE